MSIKLQRQHFDPLRLKKKKKHDEYSDNESFDISQKAGYT